MNRFSLLSVPLGALVVLTGASPAAAAPRTPTAAAAVTEIAPELNGVTVDGTQYRAVKARFDQAATALSSATSLAASSASELSELQLDDARLTRDLATATDAKKEATVAAAAARAGLKELAISAYVQGQPDAAESTDLGTATQVLRQQTLAQAVSQQQALTLHDATDKIDHAVDTITADLVARTTDRERMAVAQAAHDQAVADSARLTDDLSRQQAALLDARVTATVVGEDFALVALDAYWKAARSMAVDDPDCGISWWALAGITRSESRHGTYGGAQLLANGDVDRLIVGIPLDGTNNTAVIGDTDGGAFDGDPQFDRAVGPMQFIPSTWVRWQRDGNGDGKANPNNIYDAALAAAHYLCATGPMQSDEDLHRGFLSYNHSEAYASTVLNYAKNYAQFLIGAHQ